MKRKNCLLNEWLLVRYFARAMEWFFIFYSESIPLTVAFPPFTLPVARSYVDALIAVW